MLLLFKSIIWLLGLGLPGHLNQVAAVIKWDCTDTTSERCTFSTPDSGCLSGSEAGIEGLTDGHYYCQTSKESWAQCDEGGCFNEDKTPMKFLDSDDPRAVMCKTVPMPCQFPFVHRGVTYHECTNALLEPPEYEYDADEVEKEDFKWCATLVDANRSMIGDMWGMCDLNSCTEVEDDTEGEEESAVEPISAEVNIEPSSESNNISATISFHQESGDAPLRIQGHITGLPSGHHGLHVHSNPDTSDQCMAAGPHFNPHNSVHGSRKSDQRHAGDLGNIEADSEGSATFDFKVTGSSLFGDPEHSILRRTLVIHAEKDDLGQGNDEESKKTGNAGQRLACAIIEPKEDPSQMGLANIIIIVLVVIIVLLVLLITALIIYCCKKSQMNRTGKGEEGIAFQNGDMKKKPLAYDELSIPFIDASPAPTPKVGRSTERLSFFNRTPSIGRSRGSLSNIDEKNATA